MNWVMNQLFECHTSGTIRPQIPVVSQPTKLVFIMSTVISLPQENKSELSSIICLLHIESMLMGNSLVILIHGTNSDTNCVSASSPQ